MLLVILLLVLLLAVALFALQNADPVVVRFWPWQFHLSVALLTIGAMIVGAVMAALTTAMARLTSWNRRRAARPPVPAPGPSPDTPGPP